ncbi:MAG: DNA cytosine methyltransferase [Roseivirga sp.]|nr:DNA cytosine methyltransferase [Roseivirga sp.]
MMNWTNDIIHLDGFGGAAGFWLALSRAGFNIKKHYYSEIDKHAIAVAKYQDKHLINVGAIENVCKAGIERPDIFTFGSPCQGFSSIGKGEGLDHAGSVLVKEAINIITHYRPSVFIWENVKGVITKKHREDFWAVLQAFANIGGYRLEFQLLNTVWFLPQNRERIFVVGHLDGFSRPKIFPIGESNTGIDQESRETGPRLDGVSRCLSAHGTSRLDYETDTFIRMVDKVQDSPQIKISSATKAGYELAEHGDGIRLDHISNIERGNSTGKGRVLDKKAHTLDTTANAGVLLNDKIRRLTETEYELLQGFPTDWTKLGDYGGVIKEVSSFQRYRMMGNAISIDPVEEIAKRLKAV